MEKEVDIDVIKSTQTSLGKYVKRPPLSDKLLKKPPFRFLHDIITTIIKTTGFFDGLFDDEELVSDNVKDRDSKIAFLNKVIAVAATVTGRSLTVKPSKIVAGQEAEKTNELLQCIAFALDNNLSSEEAVKQFKSGEKPPQAPEVKKTEKPKETTKPVKGIDAKKLTSRSSEKLTNNKKDGTRDKSITRNEKDKAITNRSKLKETQAKKENPPKKPTQSKTLTKKKSFEKVVPEQNDKNSKKSKHTPADIMNNDEDQPILDTTDQDSGVSLEKQDMLDPNVRTDELIPRPNNEEETKLNSSYTIAEHDLNSSLSSQDLMEVDPNAEENKRSDIEESQDVSIKDYQHIQESGTITEIRKHIPSKEEETTVHKTEENRPPSIYKDKRRYSNQYDTNLRQENEENINHLNARPKSVRPSSSRPGAPRLREKHDNIGTVNENLMGKVNIIIENTPNEEEEDSSIIIVDQPNAPSISQDQQDVQISSSQQHGALVQQILDSQKEFSQTSGRTEIEWQFGAQKAREVVSQEIEQLRFNIQALSRVANPLGKVLDHIQEDVEVMRQELQQWSKTYEEASKELQKQKTANEDSLFPLHTKLKQLDNDIEEKRDKINDLKIIIHKNAMRIEKLLAGGDVQ